jgi:hypothetical protein
MQHRFATQCIPWLMGTVLGLSAPLHAADVSYVVGSSQGTLRSLLGINIGPLGTGTASNPALTTQYQQLGVGLIRTHDYYDPLDMATLYPDRSKDPEAQSSFNFTGKVGGDFRSSDEVFGSIVNNGFEPFFRLGDSYNNAKPPSDSERANWVKAAVNVLKHYRQGQWGGFQSSFKYVEIWNEPDNVIFWPKPYTQTQFNQLYDATAKAIRAAFPELKVGGPGLTPAGCLSDSGKRWTTAFLDHVKQNNTPLDYFSWHMYSNSPADYAHCAAYYRSALDERGLTQVPTLLTEWNTSAEENSGLSAEDKLAVRTKGKGAAILSGAWIALQQRDDVEQTLFYRGPDPSMNAPFFYGIYYANGQPKKVAQAWALWKEISSGYTKRLNITGTQADLHLLAAENDSGTRALLMSNTGTTPKTWQVALPSGTTLADYSVSVKTVSDSSTTIANSTLVGETVTTPAETVQLLILSPKVTSTFGVTASSSGTPPVQSLSAVLQVNGADIGKNGQLFLVAVVGSSLFAHNGTTWVPWGSEPVAWRTGPLAASTTLPVFSNVDVRLLKGIQVFAGYGLTVQDMLTRQLFGLVQGF